MRVGIVDAFSTGVNLANEFITKGVACYHIRTTSTPYPYDIPFKGTLFLADETSFEHLAELNLCYILAGSEMGVEATDLLNARLNKAKANSAGTTAKRRNKYLMHQSLYNNGLRCIAQFKSTDKKRIIQWVIQRDRYPVVVKPLHSAASDGVTVCDDLSGVAAAIDRILGKKNLLGKVNHEVLVQEFIDGVQYFVNTLTWEGKTYITDIWKQVRTRKWNHAFIFEGMELCDGDAAIINNFHHYICHVLEVLALRYGPAHNEIILTEDGPVLIESNARLMGASINDDIFKKTLGYTQSSLCADMFIDPVSFLASYYGRQYVMGSYLYEISFIFKKSGQLIGMPKKEEIEKLESFYCFSHLPEFNRDVVCTLDTQGKPGFVYLSHKSKEVIERDFNLVLALQAEDKIFDIV